MKMSDVYSNLPWREDGNVSFLYIEPIQNIMIAKAVNNHDRMDDEIAELREALGSMVSLIDAIWIEQSFTQDKDKTIVNYSKAKQLLNK